MTSTTTAAAAEAAAPRGGLERVPPHAYFVGSAVFHYLGPAFAVLLFARVDALGVAWLRIASAAVVFAAWRGPRRPAARPRRSGRRRPSCSPRGGGRGAPRRASTAPGGGCCSRGAPCSRS